MIFSHGILLEDERNLWLGLVTVFSLDMHAQVTVFSWNTNEIMVWTGNSVFFDRAGATPNSGVSRQ